MISRCSDFQFVSRICGLFWSIVGFLVAQEAVQLAASGVGGSLLDSLMRASRSKDRRRLRPVVARDWVTSVLRNIILMATPDRLSTARALRLSRCRRTILGTNPSASESITNGVNA